MVQLRARSAISKIQPPKQSISRSFTVGKVGIGSTKRLSAAVCEAESGPHKGEWSCCEKGEAKKWSTLQPSRSGTKRQTPSDEPADGAAPQQRKKVVKKEPDVEDDLPLLSRNRVIEATTIGYPRLPFDLQAAVNHLKSVDVRFRQLLDCVELKPYKELEEGAVRELDLFKTLAASILGQQVSWLAARAILYRFCRLFHPDKLPEKPDWDATPRDQLPFPHPLDVCQSEDSFLRTAGLSGAKVKYVKDVARRFSDGRLDVRKIVNLDEEHCIKELVQIKGVGRWTAEMLLMFALRRGNILPTGDLGVQKGMVHFFLGNEEGLKIDEKKKKPMPNDKGRQDKSAHEDDEAVPVVEEHLTESQREVENITHDIRDTNEAHLTGPLVQDYHAGAPTKKSAPLPPLPAGITSSMLRTRKEGKKAKGNVYLTPQEMEDLTKSWHPHRSIGVYLMWALID